MCMPSTIAPTFSNLINLVAWFVGYVYALPHVKIIRGPCAYVHVVWRSSSTVSIRVPCCIS
jgi:hypothetical protein